MKTNKLILGLLLLLSTILISQNNSIYEKEADENFNSRCYSTAIVNYEELIKNKTANSEIYYKAAVCYLNSRSLKHKSIPYFKKAIELRKLGDEKAVTPLFDIHLYLAEAYRLQFEPENALRVLLNYTDNQKKYESKKHAGPAYISRLINDLRLEKELKNRFGVPVNFNLPLFEKDSLGQVGSFSTMKNLKADSMLYSVRLPVKKIYPDPEYYYYESDNSNEHKTKSTHTKQRFTLKDYLTDTVVNIATLGISPDGQSLLIYKNESGYAQLYIQQLTDTNWRSAKKIIRPTNNAGWEYGEYQTLDGSELYFTSNIQGGYGGFDLYKCQRLADGSWSKARNLGPSINSEFDEVAPYPVPDGKGFYFSSNRIQADKSFEVFFVFNTKNLLFEPIPCGYPINNSDTSIFYQVSGEKRIVESAGSLGGKNKTKKIQSNVPSSRKIPKKSASSLYVYSNSELLQFALLRLNVQYKEPSSTSTDINLKLIDQASGKTLQEFSQSSAGEINILIPTATTCGLHCNSESFKSNTIKIIPSGKKEKVSQFPEFTLSAMKRGCTWQTETLEFETHSNALTAGSISELESLAHFLEANPESQVLITTNDRCFEKRNKKKAKEKLEVLSHTLQSLGSKKNQIFLKVKKESRTEKNKRKNQNQNTSENFTFRIIKLI